MRAPKYQLRKQNNEWLETIITIEQSKEKNTLEETEQRHHLRAVPSCSLQVVVEPSQQNLLWGKTKELFQGLILLQETVQLGVQTNIDLGQETSLDDLPDETQNQMLASIHDILGSNVDDAASDSLGRVNGDVVVLNDLEVGQLVLDVQDTLIDSIWHRVVDELAKKKTICLGGMEAAEVVKKKRRGQ